MGKAKGGPNQKVVAANEKKGKVEQEKAAKAASAKESELATDWEKGANTRGQSRATGEAAKADEAARKRQEKAALLAEEEAALGAGGKLKKAPTLSKKGKNKKKGDLSLLEDALVGAADKKLKKTKEAERLKQQKLKEAEAKKKAAEKPLDPLLANTQSMLSGTEADMIGRAANKALDANAASGIDGALQSLHLPAGGGGSAIPSAKALFKAFEEAKMPEVKEDYPGLKLSQYKEKVFQMWKKSSQNPANQQP
jgi:hypothetical protein